MLLTEKIFDCMFLHICPCNYVSVSIFSRVILLNEKDIIQLKQHCLIFFRAQCLFNTVKPNTWILGHVIPVSASQVFEKYRMALNVVSMEGREAKHMAIRRYSQNTNYVERWCQIFRHEFVHLIWLPTKGYDVRDSYNHKQVYIPVRVTGGQSCFCGFEKGIDDEKCRYCSHLYYGQIEESVRMGKVMVNCQLLT